MKENYSDVMQEFIDFTNEQVGIYMDAIAGFQGHHTKVLRQIHRISRPVGMSTTNETRIVYASYEDPSKPDIIHNRIIRAESYIENNSPGGSNEQHLARAILIFLFTYWEDEIRPRLAVATDKKLDEIKSNVMGDLRILRHAILHAKSVVHPKEYRRLKVVASMFSPENKIHLSYEDMHRLFILVKQDCAQLVVNQLGVKDKNILNSEIVDVAIQRN